MASKLSLGSTVKLNSGYQLPLLGFGVCASVPLCLSLSLSPPLSPAGRPRCHGADGMRYKVYQT